MQVSLFHHRIGRGVLFIHLSIRLNDQVTVEKPKYFSKQYVDAYTALLPCARARPSIYI